MKFAIGILLAPVLLSCGGPPVDFKKEEAEITHVWTDWSKKAATGKPDSIAYYFADDAIVVGQEPEPTKGKAAMVKIYADAPANFEMDFKWEDEAKPHLIKFSKDGDMAYSLDRMDAPVRDSSGKTRMQRNKILHIWKKDDNGNWKVSLLLTCPEN